MNIKEYILNLLFPIKCLGCNRDNKTYLCNECAKNIMFVDSKFGVPYIDEVYSATKYDSVLIRRLIKEMKYRFVRDISDTLSDLLISFIKFEDINMVDPVVIPVPLSRKRYNWRGFNQSELIGKKVADHFNWNFDNKILIKTKDVKPQAEIDNEQQRRDNIVGVFEARRNINRNIILIDDVTTSGATLSECAKVLIKAGAKRIIAITVAN